MQVMLKTSWKYAVLCGVFLIILYHLSYYFGMNPLINIGHLIFDIMIFGLFIFFTQKEYKAYVGNGILHFWEGMTLGFIVYVIATFIFAISLLVYFYFDEQAVINYQEEATNFLNERAEIYKDQFGEDGFSKQLNEIDSVSPGDLLISSSLKKLLAGFFITPVISIILRKQPK